MFKYICKRIIIMPIILIAASVLIFLMINLTPYDPATQLLPADYTQEQLADLHAELGLDKPLLVQYGNWLIKAVQGDFGTSWQNRAPVWNDFGPRIPKSLIVAGLTILITMLIGLPLGILCAVKQYSFVDNLVNTLCKFLASFPQFMVGLILMYIFGVKMKALPTMGFSSWKHAVLPVVTLCLTEIATYVRITRSSVLDCIRQDYVRTARSKGATLSFIGLGVQKPRPEWGSMLNEAVVYMRSDIRMMAVPAVALVITSLAINTFGDYVRDAFDPQLKGKA